MSRQLEALIKKYVTDFVESRSLKGSFDTVLTRRVALLLLFVTIVAACAHVSALQGPRFQAERGCVEQDGQQVQVAPCAFACKSKSKRLGLSTVTRRFVPTLRHTAHTTTNATGRRGDRPHESCGIDREYWCLLDQRPWFALHSSSGLAEGSHWLMAAKGHAPHTRDPLLEKSLYLFVPNHQRIQID